MGSWRILMEWVPGAEIEPTEAKITPWQERNFTVKGASHVQCPRFEHLTIWPSACCGMSTSECVQSRERRRDAFFSHTADAALIAGITAVSLASTYFEVLAHKHLLRVELARRTVWIADTLQPGVEQALAAGKTPDIALQAALLRSKGRLWAWRYLTPRAA